MMILSFGLYGTILPNAVCKLFCDIIDVVSQYLYCDSDKQWQSYYRE